MPESGSGTVGDSRVCFSEDMGATVRCELGRAGAVFLLGGRRETYRFRFSDDFEEKELSKCGNLPASRCPDRASWEACVQCGDNPDLQSHPIRVVT